jgi:hypothetical protein
MHKLIENNEVWQNIQQKEKQLQCHCIGLSVFRQLQNTQSTSMQVDGKSIPKETVEFQSKGKSRQSLAEGTAQQNIIKEFLHRRQ